MNKEWEEVKLSEVTSKIGSGSTPRGGSKVYKVSGIPLIRSQNIYNCRFSENGLVFIDEVQAEKLSNVEIEEDDILLNITGDSVARCTKVPNKYVRGRVNQHVSIIRANEEILDSEYLKYHLVNRDMQEYMLSLARMGATRAALTKSMIESLEILLPPLNEQKAIAHILSTLDDKIETNNQINQRLEELAQTIFKHWFVDFEFPNENGEPYKSSGGGMVDSELGMIPKGWEVGVLNDMIKIGSGKRPANRLNVNNESFEIPLVGASSIMGYSEEYNFNEPVLIIGRVGTHGIVQRFNKKIWASDNTLVIISKTYEYIYQILNSIDYTSLNRGSTQPLITQTDIKNYKILIPITELLLEYERFVGDIFKLHLKNGSENQNLFNLRDTLLPKLMSGELRVPLEGDDM